uniref:Uncharacterized protein n=1 Tax=Octopus bimaculoides TaxID=37653 RepID=A0A0L8FLU3_OCTBM
MAKRKVNAENRAFEIQWKTKYMFTDIDAKPALAPAKSERSLNCGANVAVLKEYDLKSQYETKHQDKYKYITAEQKQRRVEELKRNLTLQQIFLTKAKSQSEAAVKASFIVVEEIIKSAWPFTKGEFVKSYMMKMCDVLCPDKKQLFANVSISRNTVDQECEMATDLKTQLIEKGKDFVVYSLTVDETTDMTDRAQQAIFIRGVDSNLFVMEEILDIKSMHGTTEKDFFEKNICVTDMKLPWDKLVGLTTDGALAMYGENWTKHVMSTVTQTVNFIQAERLNHQFQSFLWEIHSEFGDMPYHTEVQWLSQGKVLNIVFELVEEICQFMDRKGKESKVLRDENQLQRWDHMICDMYDRVKAFQVKLCLWETQMHQLNLSHFLCCQVMLSQVSAMVFPKQHFADKLSLLCTEFTQRFSDFEAQKNNFKLLRNPFAINVETAPVQIQMELIELQCNGILKAKYDSVGPAQFTRFIPEAISQLHLHAAQTLSMFRSTYLCKQLFSVIKMNKTSHRSHLTLFKWENIL